MEVDVDTCKLSQFGLCLLSSHGNTSIVKIPTQKGIDKLNWASGERGNDISFKLFDTLHVACRTDYINLIILIMSTNKLHHKMKILKECGNVTTFIIQWF